jgi:protein-L-isoaspartate(D-aspartate) O-methyltransferase
MTNSSPKQLIEYLRGRGVLSSEAIAEALWRVRREHFINPIYLPEAYNDYPLDIGWGQTISQPSTVVFMLEKLQVKPGDQVLDVGAGSGWQSALLSVLVGPTGRVTGLEIIADLATRARENIKRYQFDNVQIIQGDGREGFLPAALYDKIIVSAASSSLPEKLLNQLRLGGRLIMPLGQGVQDLVLIKKIAHDRFAEERFPGFVFVPFVKK